MQMTARRNNFPEQNWEIVEILEKLVGSSASRNNLSRQRMLINLGDAVKAVQKSSHMMSADSYLRTINQLERLFRGII